MGNSKLFFNREDGKVSVVIPSWNGKHLLKVCLPSLRKQTFRDFEVIIVDNGSTDNSVLYIKRYFPQFKVVTLTKNLGFSPAVNIGIRSANGKYIVLINNDTFVDKDCLKKLVLAAEKHPDAGMVASKMLNYYNHKIIDSAGDYIDTVGHANNIGYGKKDEQKYNFSNYVFLVTGGGCLIKRSVFESVGLFDEDYFAYFEDVDLCLRAQMQGFKAWYEPSAVIYHMHKATSKKNIKFTEYLQFRNMTMNIIKDFPKALILDHQNWIKILLVNLNTVRYLTSQGNLNGALKAEWEVIKNLKSLLNKRKQIQNLKIVSDEYIIENVLPKKITFFGLLKNGF